MAFGAACRDTEPELFFPVGTTGMATDQIESAKSVCDHCDAQKACLEFALATNQESGVWGGTTEDERRKLRKQWLAARRRAPVITRAERSAAPTPARRYLRLGVGALFISISP